MWRWLMLLVILLAPATADASTPRAVELRPAQRLHVDGPLAHIGNVVFFTARDGAHGSELWRSEEWFTETVGDLRARERRMLAEAHDFQVVRADLDLLVALAGASAAAVERAA